MNELTSLDSLWGFIHSLSLSNRKWLASKLLESVREDEKAQEAESDAEFLDRICGGWDCDSRSTEEIINDIRNSRQFGVTRHIMPLTDEKE